MRSNSKGKTAGTGEGPWAVLALFVLFLAGGIGCGILPGCTNKTPFDGGFQGLTPTPSFTPPYPAPTTVPNRNQVDTLNSGSPSASINPNLIEMNNPPGYVLKTAGAITAVNNFASSVSIIFNGVQAAGPSGFPNAFMAQGTINDPGNNTYPAMELEAQMEGGNEYDGSFFSGVQFGLFIGTDDTTTKKDFSIPVLQTQGPPLGRCVGGNAGGCYDNFMYDLTSSPSGQWLLVNIPFSSLQQAYAGVVTNPPTFKGANLQQMLWLQWEESRNNTIGISNFHYGVCDISFY
jgi:hypothetical protein